MTFDRWAASRERFACESDEWVLEDSGVIVGWLKRSHKGETTLLSIDAHPEHEGLVGVLIDFGLGETSTEEVRCLAGAHQIRLGTLLRDRGFEPLAEFITLVKRTVVPAREDSRVRAPDAY